MKRMISFGSLTGSLPVVWLSLMPMTVLGGLYPGLSNLNHTCALVKPELSCSPNAVYGKTDSCCVETYGGLVLSTQFWSTHTGLESSSSSPPHLLPKKSWTIHGLWPDFCNGSYPEYCDLTRQYDPSPSPWVPNPYIPGPSSPNISTIITNPFGRYDLLSYMNTYWVSSLSQPNEHLWAHEFSKHATCFSTYDTECYGPTYTQTLHIEVLDYFEASIKFFNQLPTYSWLERADITPSNSTKQVYSLSKIQKALSKSFGATPYIGCSGPKYNETTQGKGSNDDGRTVLNEVWYYFHVLGRTQDGRGIPVDADINGGRVTNCAKAKGAIRYPLRTNGSERRV